MSDSVKSFSMLIIGFCIGVSFTAILFQENDRKFRDKLYNKVYHEIFLDNREFE